MKKTKVIITCAAIILASAGVFANMFVPQTLYFVGNVLETGNNCRVMVPDPSPCGTGTQCSKVQTISDVTGRYYYSYKIIDNGTIMVDCTVLSGANL